MKKKILISGMMLALFMAAPVVNSHAIDNMIGVETSYAAETYSENWRMDANGTWWYYMSDGSVAKNSWIHDHGQWYLLGADGAMRTGIFKSNGGKYYLLDTVRGTGTYGKLITNGMVYQGITIKADTSAEYEGALSDETIASLSSLFDFGSAPNVENTKHVENGQVTSVGNNASQPANFQSQTSSQVDTSHMTDDEYLYDYLGFDRPSTGNHYSSYDDSNLATIHGQ